MEKYFSINESGYSIRCKLYANSASDLKEIVLFGHGFGGHKDNKAAARFAGKIMGKHKSTGVITFDWPGHGEDAIKSISLKDCDFYLNTVVNYIRESFGVNDIFAYATPHLPKSSKSEYILNSSFVFTNSGTLPFISI